MKPDDENNDIDREKCMKIHWGDCFRVLTFRKPKEKDQYDKIGLGRNRYQQLAPQVHKSWSKWAVLKQSTLAETVHLVRASGTEPDEVGASQTDYSTKPVN